MNCRRARSLIAASTLRKLGPGSEALLGAHLERCAACSALASEEARLDGALALLSSAPHFRVDVESRVMEEAARIPVPRPEPVPARQLAWAGAAAMLLSLAVLVSGAILSPAMLGIARGAGRATLETGGFLSVLVRAWLEALSSLKPLVGAAWDVLSTAPVFLRTARPLLAGAVAVLVLAALSTTVAIIGRDLKRRAPVNHS